MTLAACDYWWNDETNVALSVVTEPTAEPIGIQEVKDQARIDGDTEDVLISTWIIAARRLAEAYLKRCFVTTVLRLNLDAFPAGEFRLYRPKLISVTSIKYRDTSGVQQTVSSSVYSVDTYSQPGRVRLAYGQSWPDARTDTNSIEVVYSAGYGAPTSVPESIKQALRFTVADWFRFREHEGQLPDVAKTLLSAEAWGFLP